MYVRRLSTLNAVPFALQVACSDMATDITAGTAKATFRMPAAMTLTAVRASASVAPVGSSIVIDINEAGSSVLSTPVSINSGLTSSFLSGDGAPVISNPTLTDNAEITIDFDQVGSSTPGSGVIVALIGTYA